MICAQPYGQPLGGFLDDLRYVVETGVEIVETGADYIERGARAIDDAFNGGGSSSSRRAAPITEETWIELETAQRAILHSPFGWYMFSRTGLSGAHFQAILTRAIQIVKAIRAGVPNGSHVSVRIVGPNMVRVQTSCPGFARSRDVSADYLASYDPSRPVASGWARELATLEARCRSALQEQIRGHFQSRADARTHSVPSVAEADFMPLKPKAGAAPTGGGGGGGGWGKVLIAGGLYLAWREYQKTKKRGTK